MIVVSVIGGLGNQMFQYAFAYAVSQEKKSTLKLDIRAFDNYHLRQYQLDQYSIVGEIATSDESDRLKYKKESLLGSIFRKMLRKPKRLASTYYKESYFQFDKTVFNTQGDIYFEGYWQSEKYFKKYREDILRIFTLKESIHYKTKQYQQKINNAESVSLHIRRGDYVTNTHANRMHGTCSVEYYCKAIYFLKNKLSNPCFFVFSDDLVWAKENLSFMDQILFIELEKNTPDHEEMYLMSLCKHNIIANSSFSWWGAWLNQNPNKIVIIPQRWFMDATINTNDLIPKSWICL